MTDQAKSWSKAAENYDEDFVDPFEPDTDNPLMPWLEGIPDPKSKTIGDLGCGTGPILSFLAKRFGHVYAVDFAPGMLEKARENAGGHKNITFLEQRLTDLSNLEGELDVAIAVNSLVMPDVSDLEKSLAQIFASLCPGGLFGAILPAMDAIHYYTMLLLDRALEKGLPIKMAKQKAAKDGEHDLYDFAFGEFKFKGLHQHFWQPFEIPFRLKKAGFRKVYKSQVRLAWDQFAYGGELAEQPPSWDWFARAEKPT